MHVRDARMVQTTLQIVTHHSAFVEWVEAWRLTELERLAYVKGDVGVQQGRVQILDELSKMFRNADVDSARVRT